MANYSCNSCGTVYPEKHPDGRPNYHACHPDVIVQRATFGADGKQITEEKREPRADLRDENPRPGMLYVDGVLMVETPDPETPGRILIKPGEYAIVAEGAGRTLVTE